MSDTLTNNNFASLNPASSFPQNWNLQKLVDASPIGITRVTLDGRILYANAAFVRMFEVSSLPNLIGQNILQFYEGPEIRANILEQLRRDRIVENFEVTLCTMKGNRRNTLLSLILDGDLLSSMVLDITDREQAKAESQVMLTRLRLLADASKAFSEASTDYNKLLQVITRVTAEKIQGGCVIRLVSKDGQWLDPVAFYDVDAKAQAMMQAIFAESRVHVNDAMSGAIAFRTGQPVLTTAFEWHRLRPKVRPVFWPLFDNVTLFSTVAAPLLAQGKSIGALFIFRHDVGLSAFDEYDMSITQDLADRAATAISHARLFEQVQHELAERKRIEAEISKATTRLQILADASRIFVEVVSDYQTLLSKVTRTISRAMHASTIVRMLSEDKRWLNIVAANSIDLPEMDFPPSGSVVMGNSLSVDDAHMCAQVFRRGQALLDANVDSERYRATLHKDFHATFDMYPVRSIVVVPLITRGEIIGTLAIYRTDRDQPALTPLDMQLAQDLADRAAMAIMNAQLFQEVHHERASLAQRVQERTADLSLANAQLSQAMRLKDDFLASMSHELRTPLNSVLGRTEAILEEIYGPLTTQQIKSLRGVEESGHHLLNLINDILDVAKIDSGVLTLDYDLVHVDMLCTSSIRMIAQTAQQRQIKVITTIDTTTEFVYADQRRLQQILVNLLSNAVKFTSAGGKIGLEVVGNEAEQTLTFTVWDTGIGISQQDLPKLFKSFVQIDSSLTHQYTGTGLGLALVLRLTEAHQGCVRVESEVGKGSRFSVVLPWNKQQTISSIANGNRNNTTSYPIGYIGSQQPLSAARILLVEDNQTNIDVIQDYLQRKGYEIAVARNGAEAVRMAQECQPQVILMDIQMPVMDGLQATQQIRKLDAVNAIPIVALTALAMPGDRERCIAAGTNAYLTKPVDLDNLVQTIEAQIRAAKG